MESKQGCNASNPKSFMRIFEHICPNAWLADQAPVKTVELINALKACLAKSQGSKPSNSGCTVHPPIEVLVGEECTAIKQEMQFKEQVLLRETSFNLHVNNTQKYLLNFGKSAEMQASTVQIASFLCNDSLVYTNLCTQYEAAEIAAGCLVAASLIGRIARLHKQSLDFSNFGLPKLRVEAVAHLLFEMLEVTNPDNAS